MSACGVQTLLFSATMPSALHEFAKAGLRDPEMVRLDVESRISPDLGLAFFSVRCAGVPWLSGRCLACLMDGIGCHCAQRVCMSVKWRIDDLPSSMSSRALLERLVL